jgi:hypothetical protein
MIICRPFLLIIVLFLAQASFAQKYSVLKEWTYRPLRPTFWEKFEKKLNSGELSTAILYTEEELGKTRDLEKAEVEYAQVLTLKKMNQTVLAYHRALDLMEKAPGSMPSLGALQVVDQLAQTEDHDLSDAKRIINSGTFKEVPHENIPFVQYLVTYDLRERNYKTWTDNSEKNIPENSFWSVFYQSQDFILNLPNEITPETLSQWQALREKATPYPRLLKILQFEEARFFHKLKKFDKANELYSSMKLTGRDYGTALFERSWSLYGMKQYSESLGLLQNLKSQTLRLSIDPESYLLAMSIYRDLCHYPAVRIVKKDFYKTFAPTIKAIRAGAPLDQDSVLVRMTAQRGPWQVSADEIAQLKVQEKDLKKDLINLNKNFVAKISTEQQQLDALLIRRLNHASAEGFKKSAELLLQTLEQVKLLEYIADLDEYRLGRADENRDYASDKADINATNGLFWKVDGESWSDEMGSYQAVITDRCKAEPKARR